MSVDTHKETLGFQTEVKQLLHLMIHSLYSNKEIFLRELVSNASDASDKLRFEALSDDALYEGDNELAITVSYDKDKRTVTIRDNGIGMSRQEVIDNIGTIAKSGTRQFLQSLSGDKAKDAHLIGQFGVGFYSAFIIADRVSLYTRRAGMGSEHGVLWQSNGEGEFTIETIDREQRGTEVILHLREGEEEFLDGYRLRNIIRKYSDHITLPIHMPAEGGEDKQGEMETVNRASALWVRPKNEVKDEEYNEFYKHVAHDFEDPLAYVHSRVEGKLEYTSLLYVPARAPFDLWERDNRRGLKLYVRRVFIMEDSEHLMPTYLRFIRGVIDSNDLPLNVSREILQQNRVVDSIKAGSVKKILGMLESLSTDKEKYATFWREFGKVLKEGPGEDYENRERIAKLFRFATTKGDGDKQETSLQDYVGRMAKGQDKIYYVTADSFNAARNSPHLEIFRKKNIEVLLLTDRVDEWMVASLQEFDGKKLHSVAKGELDLGGVEDKEEKKQQEKQAKELEPLLERITQTLGDKVKEVRVTHRLTDSPACLVVESDDMSAHLERMLKAAGQNLPSSKPIFEINAKHTLIERLNGEKDEQRFSDLTHVLFDQSVLSEGGQLDDPAGFVRRVNQMLAG